MDREDLALDAVAAADAILDPDAGADDDLLSGPYWSRHPADIARALLAALVLALTLGLAVLHPADSRTFAVDVVELVDGLPSWVRDVILGTAQLLAVVVPLVILLVVRRRPRLLLTTLGAATVAAVAMAGIRQWLDDAVPSRVILLAERPSWITDAGFPTSAYIAALTAALVVISAVLPRGWRRLAAAGLALALFSRVVTAVAALLNLGVTVALGALVGSAALALFGSPRRSASRRAVLDGLASAGFPAERIDPVEVGAHNARTFLATTRSGREAFVKLLGRDERDADLLSRLIRQLRVKDLDDERPGWTPAHLAEHEAYSALLAGRSGVSVAPVVAAGTTAGGDGLVALDVVEGVGLDELPLDAVTDDLLDEVWRQVALLHRQGLAHGWLTADHVLVRGADGHDGAGSPEVTLLDLRWARHQAAPERLAADVATLVTSLALVVGAERSVAAAARSLGTADLAAALPLVQPLVMPAELRKAVKDQKHVLPAVRDRLQDEAGDVEYQLADVARVGKAQLLTLLGGVVMGYVLLAFISSWADISANLRAVAPWAYVVLTILASIPYVTGAGTLMAVSPAPLPFVEVVKLMFAQSFLNRFTPANAGGMALRVRYLQKHGVDLGGAAAGVGLTSVASGITQVAVIITFFVWSGSSTTERAFSFDIPKVNAIAWVVGIVSVLAGLIWFTPWGRRVIGERILTTASQVWTTLRGIAAEPGRFVVLFGTCTISKFATITAFTVSCRAMDVTISYPRLGLLYLTASSVASAAPTPGGLGAVEAALTAALTGVGVPPAEALSAVFLFRLMTFWLPVPFGWLAFQRLQKAILD
jgi:undecaprenyl-diphosphatase